MDVSIIIVNYKTPQLTIDCVKSVHKSLHLENISYEIIVVDNYSNDGNIYRLKALEDEHTHVVETVKNGGFGYGNNRGVEHSVGNYLFFLNSDTILYQKVVVQMWRYMINNPQTGVLGCLMNDVDNKIVVSAHSFENTISLFNQTIIKPFIPKFVQDIRCKRFANKSRMKKNQKCDWVSGAGLMISRDVFYKVKGWNEEYFMYMEDEELCYRVWQRGYKVELFPEVGLQHLEGKSGGSSLVAYERYKSKFMYFNTIVKRNMYINKKLLLIQAKQYMRKLSDCEKKVILQKLCNFMNV